MRARTIGLGGFAALTTLTTLAACQPGSSAFTLTLAAVHHPAFVQVNLEAKAPPETRIAVVAHYGATTQRQVVIANEHGIATSSYDLPSKARIQFFSVTASVTEHAHGSVSRSTASATISL